MPDEVKPKVEMPNNQQRKKNTNEEWFVPTQNLEKVTFDYGPVMKPVEFNTRLNHLAEYMANLLKHGGTQLSKAYKSREKPFIVFSDKLTEEEREDPGAIKD